MLRSFNRFELKYLISTDQAQAVGTDLARFLTPDRHGEGGRYALTSLYYDSPDLVCYWAKVDGLKVRRKLRVRHYESAGVLGADDPGVPPQEFLRAVRDRAAGQRVTLLTGYDTGAL